MSDIKILSSEICRPIRAHVCAYEHVSRSYELVREWIYMSRDIYVDIIGLKFEKDLVGGCGEIDDLLGQHN